METKQFQFPGDPVQKAVIMTGAEFKALYRGGGPGSIQVNDEEPMYFDEIICDLCNTEIQLDDRCMLISSYLYCDRCSSEKEKYLV